MFGLLKSITNKKVIQEDQSPLYTQIDDQSLYVKFMNEINGSEEDGWRPVTQDGVRVWKKEAVGGSTVNSVKATGVVDFSTHTIKELLWNQEKRLQWDKYMAEARVVERLGGNSEVYYFVVNTPTGIAARDFVQYRNYRFSNNSYAIYFQSVRHPDAPATSKYVRGETHISGYLIRPFEEVYDECLYDESEGGTKGASEKSVITYISQTDLKGNIPSALSNLVSSKTPSKWFTNLEKACQTNVITTTS